MKGVIFDIQRFSTHDGPGIRTTVFFKGCPLRCFWCHNPESISPKPEILVKQAACIGCGRCTEACLNAAVSGPGQIDRAACTACGRCAEACPTRALALSGRSADTGEVLAQVLKDRAFYSRSGGGMTISGGEALLQSSFAAELLAACKREGIHTAVDTAGDVPYQAFEDVLPYTDLFLYDVKAASPGLHRKGCGKDNGRIVENLRRLSESGAEIRLRIPVIPGFNDNPEEMERIGALIGSLSGKQPADLLRFHRMGAVKYEGLQREYAAKAFEPPDDALMRRLAEILKPHCACIQIQ